MKGKEVQFTARLHGDSKHSPQEWGTGPDSCLKDRILATTKSLTEVGSSQYKSHFLPFFPSHEPLDDKKDADVPLHNTHSLVKDEAIRNDLFKCSLKLL